MAHRTSPFRHESRLEGRQIRLIQILPTSRSQIYCSLITVSLDDTIKYNALSYVWGDPSRKCRIFCNGRPFDVTQSLYLALEHFRDIRPDTLIWADAICINQACKQERTSQVRMMSQIYRRADLVVIWLGEEEKPDCEAYAMARVLSNISAENASSLNLWTNIPGLPNNQSDPKWGGLKRLLTRPWFSRIWVVQELFMAQSSIFVCGKLDMQTDVLLNAASCIMSSTSLSLGFNLHHGWDRPAAALPGAMGLAPLIRMMRNSGNIPISHLLIATKSFRATEQRDKIFALIALAGDMPIEFINYERSVKQVLTDLAIKMLTDPDLQLPSPILSLAYTVHCQGNSDIPSWVPDWTGADLAIVPIHALLEINGSSRYGDCQFSNNPDQTLTVKGKTVDKIKEIISPTPHLISWEAVSLTEGLSRAEDFYNWLSRCSQLANGAETYSKVMSHEEALWRTLTANGAPDAIPIPIECIEAYRARKQLISLLVQLRKELKITEICKILGSWLICLLGFSFIGYVLYGCATDKISTLDIIIAFGCWYISHHCARYMISLASRALFSSYVTTTEDTPNQIKQLSIRSQPFDKYFLKISAGRRFCKTEKGFLGWVTLKASVGDEIVAFLGSRTLFTVRRDEFKTGGEIQTVDLGITYCLTGDCYIQGLMDGEGIRMDVPEQNFVLV